MCVACLVTSALLMFTPGEPDALTTAKPVSLAQDTRVAIAEVMEELPTTSDIKVLRDSLKTLDQKLLTTKTDAETDALIDSHLQNLQTQVFANPNAEQVIAALENIVIGDELPSDPNSTVLPQNKTMKLLAPKGQGLNWGWVK
jgi:hypothetical protein